MISRSAPASPSHVGISGLMTPECLSREASPGPESYPDSSVPSPAGQLATSQSAPGSPGHPFTSSQSTHKGRLMQAIVTNGVGGDAVREGEVLLLYFWQDFFHDVSVRNGFRFWKQKNIWCLEMPWRTILYLQLVNIVQLLLLYKRHIITGTNYALRLCALSAVDIHDTWLTFLSEFYSFVTVEILSAPMLASGGLANVATKSRTARRVHRPRSRSSRAPSRLNISRSPSVNVFTKWTIIELIHLASCYVETLHLHCIICLSSKHTQTQTRTHCKLHFISTA